MNHILRISEAASLALHTMTLLAGSTQRVSARQMAGRMKVSEAHLAKVLQRLAHAELVRSIRGPGGGFGLARPAGQITLLEIYQTLEGPMHTGSCLMSTAMCDRRRCILGDLLASVGEQVQTHFAKTTLADLVESTAASPSADQRQRDAHLNLWP